MLMNKIFMENDKIIKSDVEYQYNDNVDIKEISIDIDKDMDLSINIKDGTKITVIFNVLDNVHCNLFLLTLGSANQVEYQYNVGKKASCQVEKLNIVNGINEMITASLEEDSNFSYLFKSIAEGHEKYDYMIYHNGVRSNSNVINHSINEQGSIYYQISSFVPKNIIGCCANQYNRILNLTANKCEIRPNLYIDCHDVEANHSALIDLLDEKELFYLKTRGIKEDKAKQLLIKGFLISKLKNKEFIDLIKQRLGGE